MSVRSIWPINVVQICCFLILYLDDLSTVESGMLNLQPTGDLIVLNILLFISFRSVSFCFIFRCSNVGHINTYKLLYLLDVLTPFYHYIMTFFVSFYCF